MGSLICLSIITLELKKEVIVLNKIKLMYDVAKAMKEKEVFIGSLEVGGKKDQTEFFALKNEFEKNLVSGQVKVKINTVLDLEGKQVKHESSSEFNLQNCCSGKHHHMIKHFHSHCHNSEPNCCCTGLKGKLSALAYILRLIDNVKIEELENNALTLSLNIDEIPEDLMKHIHGKFQHCMPNEASHDQECCSYINDLMAIENLVLAVNMHLNQDRAIEKIVVTAEGKQKDKLDGIHEMSFRADLNLKW